MQKPHEFVLNEVQCRWSYKHPKGFFRRLLAFGTMAVAIDIIEIESIDDEEKRCAGEILNRWKYDDAGLQIVPEKIDIYQYKVERYWYCFDREKKRLLVVRARFLPRVSLKKEVQYYHSGRLYEIVENDGIEEFKVIGFWMD